MANLWQYTVSDGFSLPQDSVSKRKRQWLGLEGAMRHLSHSIWKCPIEIRKFTKNINEWLIEILNVNRKCPIIKLLIPITEKVLVKSQKTTNDNKIIKGIVDNRHVDRKAWRISNLAITIYLFITVLIQVFLTEMCVILGHAVWYWWHAVWYKFSQRSKNVSVTQKKYFTPVFRLIVFYQ